MKSCCIHMNSQFYHTRHMVWDLYLFSLLDHGELTLTQCFIALDSQGEIINWSLSELTVKSCCAHMNSQFYHTELTAWDHHLISLWDHGELTGTQCFITLDSQYDIIIWSHCEIMLYSHELTVLSHQTHGMRSLSVLTVRSWWAHINSMFYHIGLTGWDH